MFKTVGWLFTEGIDQNVFEELQAGDGIEGILTFLDNDILLEMVTAK